MANIQTVSDSFQCSACGACNVVCAKNAIDFDWSTMGRKYAKVDSDKCTNCGLCVKVCPSLDYLQLDSKYQDKYIGDIIKVYVGRATEEKLFNNGQSGGVCTALITHLFDTHKIDAAVVVMMNIGNSPHVKGVLITKKEDLIYSQKSCYTPVDLLSTLKENLKDYSSIAVVGLPCHLHGLTALMQTNRKFNNIKYKIGLVCDRTLGKTIQDVMAALANIYGMPYKIEWRKKNFQYHGQQYFYNNAPVTLLNGEGHVIGVLSKNARMVLKDFFTVPKCRSCTDKINIHADIVCGDPHRMPDVDMIKGSSVIATRTEIGENLIQECINNRIICVEERPVNQFISGQLIEERKKNKNINNKIVIDKFIDRENHSKEDNVRYAKRILESKYSYLSKIKILIKKIIK